MPLQCKYCGHPARNLQSLRIHLRWCKKRPKKVRSSFEIEETELNKFNAFCKAHKTTVCKMVSTIIKAINLANERGQPLTIYTHKDQIRLATTENPVLVNIGKIDLKFLGKPRSPYGVLQRVTVYSSLSCPKCGSEHLRRKPFRRFGIYNGSYYECLRCKHYFSRWG